MKIAIFGAGYVGCVSAACLAKLGNQVWLVEVAEEKLALLRAGKSPVEEPGLNELLGTHLHSGVIKPVNSTVEAVSQTELAMICVGTPSRPDGSVNLTYLKKVFSEIAEALAHRAPHTDPLPKVERGNGRDYVVVLRSTVPYALAEAELLPVLADKNAGFALNPEFLREGSAIKDFFEPPFVVVGTKDAVAEAFLRKLYEPVVAPLFVVAPGSASLLKYACNAFHAAKVVFANEIAALAPAYQADANDVMDLFTKDKVLNISPAYLRPGFAYGGSCLPKDLRALGRVAAVAGIATPMLGAALDSNNRLVEQAVERIHESGLRQIALIGLSFKTGTDDLRESPYVRLAEGLIGKGCQLKIYDPDIQPERLLGRNLQYSQQHLAHLGSLLQHDAQSALWDRELIIVGKTMPGMQELLALAPAGATVLDLTRRLPTSDKSPRIVRLGEW